MRTIIAGSRTITDLQLLKTVIEQSRFTITTVLCGMANGIDFLGNLWADENKILVEKYYPNWNLYGKKAGPIRNEEMAKNADALIAIWDGKSAGTRNMILLAERYDLKTFLYITTHKINKDLLF